MEEKPKIAVVNVGTIGHIGHGKTTLAARAIPEPDPALLPGLRAVAEGLLPNLSYEDRCFLSFYIQVVERKDAPHADQDPVAG